MSGPARGPGREAAATLGVGVLVAALCLLIARLQPAFFWHDDCQIGGVSMMAELYRALANGEWPLVQGSTWSMAGVAGEYQPGVFSVLTLPAMAGAGALGALGATMPGMATGFATYVLAITAMGAYRLARGEELAPPYAVIVALVAALNGWSMGWAASNWIPAATGFAALTWTWWALARAMRPGAGTGALLVAGFAVYVLMTAGWPHTIFMMAVVTAWLVVRAGWAERSVRALGPAVGGWLLGIGLSAPAWLIFVDYLGATNRSDVGSRLQWGWLVPLDALPALVIPSWISHWENFAHVGIELANGLVPTAMLLAVLAARDRRVVAPGGWALALAGVGLALACLPSIGMFRWSFRWLPLFHTALALAAAHWLAARHAGLTPEAVGWLRRPGLARWAGNPGAWAALAVVVVGIWSRGFTILSPALPITYFGLAVAWAFVEDRRRRGDPERAWAPAGVVLGALVVAYATIPNGLHVPFWRLDEDIRKVEPLRAGVRYVALTTGGDYFIDGVKMPTWGNLIRPGNTAMLAGVEFVNGYSALQLRGLTHTFVVEIHGYTNTYTIDQLADFGAAPGGLLARVGVDGIVLGDAVRKLAPKIVAHGWEVTAVAPEGVVLHRKGAPSPRLWAAPAVRTAELLSDPSWEGAITKVDGIPALASSPERPPGVVTRYAPRVVTRRWNGRNAEAFEVGPGAGPAMVATARAWLPGYEAIAPDGRSLPIVALDGTIIGVEVPADVAGEVVVRYRPRALVIGAWIAAATMLLMLVLGLRARSARARRPGGGVVDDAV